MNLHDAKKRSIRRQRRKRRGIGLGSGNGKTGGRGMKGQKSRSGYSRRYAFEGGQMIIWRRLPKVGFDNSRHARRYLCVNVGDLERFPEGSHVGWEELEAAGLLGERPGNPRIAGIKILGNGELSHPLTLAVHKLSATAREKLVKAGCTLVELTGRYRPGGFGATEEE